MDRPGTKTLLDFFPRFYGPARVPVRRGVFSGSKTEIYYNPVMKISCNTGEP
jgi:hypothetical protein